MDAGSMTELVCPNEQCRVSFWVPTDLFEKAKEKGQHVTCPNDHYIVWNDGASRRERKAEERAQRAEETAKRERRYRTGVEHDLFGSRDELADILTTLRKCPFCGWRSRRKRVDRVVADHFGHLVETHGLKLTDEAVGIMERAV